MARLLELRAGEERPVLLLALLYACLTGAFLIGRTGVDAIFLTELGARPLPYAYLASAVLCALVALGIELVGRRVPRELVFLVACAVLGSLTFVFRLGIDAGGRGGIFALHIWIDVVGAIAVLHIGAFVDRFFPDHERARILHLVEGAAVLVGMAAGAGIWAAMTVRPAKDLLVAAAALLWVAIVPTFLLFLAANRRPQPDARVAHRAGVRGTLRLALGSSHVGGVAGMVAIALATVLLVDFQFKSLVVAERDALPSAEAVAAFLGSLVAVGALVGAAAKLVVAPALRARFGLVGVLLTIPVVTCAALGVLVAVPSILVAIVARLTHDTVRWSVSDPLIERLILPLPRSERDAARSVIEGAVRPASLVFVAAFIAFAQHQKLDLSGLALVTLLPAGLLILVLRRVRVDYALSIGSALRRRVIPARIKLRALERDAAIVVPRTLATQNARAVEGALELLPFHPSPLGGPVALHVQHPNERARILACEHLARTRDAAHANVLRARLEDESIEVRASAIRALAAVGGPGVRDEVTALLGSAEGAVRAAAAAALLANGLDPAAGRGAIEALVRDEEGALRREGARAIGWAGSPELAEALLPLIEDPDSRVRTAAVEAAASVRTPAVLEALGGSLASRTHGWLAERALAAYGTETLGPLLYHEASRPARAARIARAIARRGGAEAVHILVLDLYGPGEALRGAIAASLARAVRESPDAPMDASRVQGACLVEVGVALRALACAEALGLPERPSQPGRAGSDAAFATALLASALAEKHDRAVERIFFLLAALHPHAVAGPPEPERRGSTVAALGSILDAALRGRLARLFGEATRAGKLAGETGVLRPKAQDRDAWLAELLTDESPWILACAARYAGAHRVTAVKERVRALLERPELIVREEALEALEQLLPIGELSRALASIIWDERDPIRKRVDAVLERIVDQVELDRARGTVEVQNA